MAGRGDELDRLADVHRYADLSGTKLVAHTEYVRDYLGRLVDLHHQKDAATLARYQFEHDSRGRITNIDSVFANSAWDETHAYTYDDTDQLIAADHSLQDDEAYGWDKNGNRSGNQTFLGSTTSSTTSANNRITSDGRYTYTYNDEGGIATRTSVANGEVHEYTYDYRMRLTTVTIKNNMSVIQRTIEYRYDHDNLLLRRIETPYSGGTPGTATTNIFVHDENQIVLAFKRVGSGDPELTNRFTWGPGWDHLISDEQVTSLGSAGTVHWALQNQINSVADVVTYDVGQDETTIVKHRQFDSFGNIVSDSASGVTAMFAFTGKFYDTATGLQWNINRWYAPWLGKWISEDPIGFEGGDENLGRYAGNTSPRHVDPSGLWRQVEGDIWEADDGDGFDVLTAMVGKSGVAKFAIRPIPPSISAGCTIKDDDARKAWNSEKTLRCARYDTSYLTNPPKGGGHISISIGTDDNNYIRTAGTFFGSKPVANGSDAVLAIGEASKFGREPLDTVWIVGHGDGNKIGGMQLGKVTNGLTTGMFGRPFAFPGWDDAIAGKLTAGFWFGEMATVQLIGCNTLKLAGNFAKSLLWKTAVARGTTKRTHALGGGEMGWESKVNVIMTNKDGTNHSATNPKDYFRMKYWQAKGGDTDYPF
jgi:RHS repeat-associated protein